MQIIQLIAERNCNGLLPVCGIIHSAWPRISPLQLVARPKAENNASKSLWKRETEHRNRAKSQFRSSENPGSFFPFNTIITGINHEKKVNLHNKRALIVSGLIANILKNAFLSLPRYLNDAEPRTAFPALKMRFGQLTTSIHKQRY
jgi:hypothetical protein